MKISGIALFHQALVALVSAFLITSAWWLVTGSTPDMYELMLSAFVLDCVVKLFLYTRRAVEVSTLHKMYDQPSAEKGEK